MNRNVRRRLQFGLMVLAVVMLCILRQQGLDQSYSESDILSHSGAESTVLAETTVPVVESYFSEEGICSRQNSFMDEDEFLLSHPEVKKFRKCQPDGHFHYQGQYEHLNNLFKLAFPI